MRRPLLAVIRLYQLALSLIDGGHCRFEPSSSRCAAEAVERHGALGEGALTIRRSLRCTLLWRAGFEPAPGNAT